MPDLGYENPGEDDVGELQSGRESEDVEVNRNLFKDKNGFHIAFFLHKSIKKNFSRRNLTRDIEKHGGTVLDTDVGCDTVLVDVMYDRKETLQISYNTDNDPRLRKIFVERTPFVQHCIRSNHFVHKMPAPKGMGGTVGRVRVSFTAHDDECLCYYLARVLPDKATGGRLGLEVYKELVRAAALRRTHAWGARHTAESWKERYKKNAAKFDEWIEDIVKQEGRSTKQLWPEDRRLNHKALRNRHEVELEAESSDENYEEEHIQPPGKRRRSDRSPPPPNRRRVIQRSSDQQVRMRLNSDRKGKARALEEEDEDEDELDQLEDYGDQDEPGPSGSRRSSGATNVTVDVLTHRTQPNTTSFFTQETIVATAPSGKSRESKDASLLLDEAAESSPLLRQSIRLIGEAKQASPSEHEPIAIIDLTSPSGSIGRSSPVAQLSPTRTLVNPSQTQEVRSTYKRPLKAARRPRTMIQTAVVDAPYRNTRSRSQSVEPSVPGSPVRRLKKRRNKETRETRPALPTVDERDDGRQDNEDLEVANEPMPLPSREILADEIDVEKMLFSDDEELGDVNSARGVSLDTDDAQTEQNLRPKQLSGQAFSSLRMHPSDILREFQESSAAGTSRYSVPLTTRPHLAVPVRNTQEKSGNIPPSSLSRNLPDTHMTAEPPATPLRRNSVSSTDSFPLSGTRASALKKKIQQQEKRNLYQPPSGTRAAKFARSRR